MSICFVILFILFQNYDIIILVINMNGYEKRTQLKKDSIIEAAWELFAANGVSNVSIKEIASKAKVSQVSIYNYFGSKANLAKEVLIDYVDKAIVGYEKILEMDVSFKEKLQLIVDIKHKATEELSQSAFSEFAWGDKTLQNIYRDAANSKAKMIYTKFIQQGKAEGAIDNNIPDEAIVDFLMSSISIMENSNYLNTSAEYKNGIIKLFFYGVLG